jgi:hypothetical protein
MGTALERWQNNVGNLGLFLNQFDSQNVVLTGELPDLSSYNPLPDYVCIKFGGDWGGLWGNPENWGKLSPHNVSEYPRIIPYLYCVPEYANTYRDVVGGLIADGFPAVVLDMEMDFDRREGYARSIMQDMNCQDNLIAVTGFAWFNGWSDQGQAFSDIMKTFDIIYLPQVYLSDFHNPDSGLQIVAEYSRLFSGLPMLPVYDRVAFAKLQPLSDHRPCALWCYQQKTSWPSDQTTTVADVSTGADINTALGQALVYCDELAEYLKPYKSANADNLIQAIQNCLHTARRLNNGE